MPKARKTHDWLMKTSGVGVPKKTVWHSAKSVLNASVTRSHWAGPMNSRSAHCSSGRSRLCACIANVCALHSPVDSTLAIGFDWGWRFIAEL